MDDFPFNVNNSHDPKVVKSALRGLRMMIKLGKLAERTLKELEEIGSAGRAVIPLRNETHSADDGWGIHPYILQTVEFPPFQTVSRKNVPDYKDLCIKTGQIGKWIVSKTEVPTVRLHCGGTAILFDNRKKEVWTGDSMALQPHHHFGTARVKSNKEITIEWTNDVGPIPWDGRIGTAVTKIPGPKSPDWNKAQRALAIAFARSLIHTTGNSKFGDWDVAHSHAPQWMVDLQEKLSDWLVEDGKAEEWLIQIREMVPIACIMGR